MSDHIKRDAIEEMFENARLISDGEYSGYCTEDINIDAIPSADVVERKRGEWVRFDFAEIPSVMECSCCGERIWLTTFYEDSHDFCGACGADMRGENRDEIN